MDLKINHKGTTIIALIDDEDYPLLKGRRVFIHGKQGNQYCAIKYNSKSLQLHRVITKCPEHLKVDHINNNFLDNRKANLRICTQKNNSRNSQKRKNASSKYKGVSWHKQHKKWYVRIIVNYKFISLGLYNDEKEAAKVYNSAAKKYFGEFALVNKIED